MRSFEEFNELFQEDLLPPLEELRKDITWRNTLQLGILIAIGVILVVFFVLVAMQLFSVWVLAILGLLLMAGGIWQVRNLSKRQDIQAKYKKLVISKIIEFVAPRREYYPDDFIPYRNFKESGLFRREPDYYHGDDLVLTEEEGTDVKLSEVKAAWNEQSKNNKGEDSDTWHIIFSGIFMVGYLRQNFPHTVILPDVARGSFGKFGFDTKKANQQYGEFVEVNHPSFDDYFAAYAADAKQVERLLSDDFMDAMVDIAQTIEEPIYMSLKGRKMFVAIHYDRDLFEINPYSTKIIDPQKPYTLFRELEFLTSIGSTLRGIKEKAVFQEIEERMPTLYDKFERLDEDENRQGTLGGMEEMEGFEGIDLSKYMS